MSHKLPDNVKNQEPLDREDIDDVLEELKQIRYCLTILLDSPIAKNVTKRRLFAIHFFKGIFLGLGSFFGATLVVSLIVFLLSHVQFVPIMGDFVKDILLEIQK